MNYLIFPDDPSTSFMNVVLEEVMSAGLGDKLEVITCSASDSAYEEAFVKISNIPTGSRVIFIGHSTPSILYGGADMAFTRKPLIQLDTISTFKDKELVLISCFSSKLIESSRRHRNYAKCIGFGLLPSELGEVDSHAGMRKIELEQDDIDNFKVMLAGVISDALCQMLEKDLDIFALFRYLKILLNKSANDFIIKDKNEKLGELLFYVCTEAVVE
ncbi:hypothetical protein [Motilimonas sp. KMU-193]|uniref:hypothetical protein n=1 Tax=Motilimonas sp. KMU-193 TaxID=3388668 RepID=UPI00396AFCFA